MAKFGSRAKPPIVRGIQIRVLAQPGIYQICCVATLCISLNLCIVPLGFHFMIEYGNVFSFSIFKDGNKRVQGMTDRHKPWAGLRIAVRRGRLCILPNPPVLGVAQDLTPRFQTEYLKVEERKETEYKEKSHSDKGALFLSAHSRPIRLLSGENFLVWANLFSSHEICPLLFCWWETGSCSILHL